MTPFVVYVTRAIAQPLPPKRVANVSFRCIRVPFALVALGAIVLPGPAPAQVVIEHTFTGGPSDGSGPVGALVPLGSSFFGMTSQGGSAGFGTIFSIGTGGTGYTILRSFAGGLADGANPLGTLAQSGGIFYGTTSGGGSATNAGTVFEINPDGTGFSVLHGFMGGTADGFNPVGSPVVSGGVIYGMTSQGGTANVGTIYRMNPDGTGFQVIHSFTGGAADGQTPAYSAVVVSNGVIYGMTPGGGPAPGFGVIYKMNTDGTGFTILHAFNFSNGDGYDPLSGLTLVGNTLYGMAYQGGAHGVGTIFQINTDGTGYSQLHNFAGAPNDGANPTGNDLSAVGPTLYGATDRGGTDNLGVLLGVNMDGSDYTVEHSFLGGANDGSGPVGTPVDLNGVLYGMTTQGGSANDGVIYSFAVPEPSSLLLAAAGAVAFLARRRFGKRPS